MLIQRKLGSTSNAIRVTLRSSSTGQGLTGLTHSSSGLIISTIADNEETATAYTSGGSTVETITTLGTFATPTSGKCRFKEVDATNHPGLYEIQVADARFAVSSAKVLRVTISGVANLLSRDVVIQLTTFDLDSASPDVNTVKVSGTQQTAGDLKLLIDTLSAYVDTEIATLVANVSTVLSRIGVPATDITTIVNAVGSAVAALGSPMQAGTDVTLSASQANYAPAKAGDAMTLTSAYDFSKGTVAPTESYRSTGGVPTPIQALLELIAHLGESSISGTTKTIKKVDGSTTAKTFTLDSSTAPTSITEAT